jgi:hypothetical protein
MMDNFFFYLRKANHEFGRLVSSMDMTGWFVLGVVALIIGIFLLRGNALRAS